MAYKEPLTHRYTCREVAQCYGVSFRTVHKWIKSGKLHAVRVGKCYYITAADLRAMERKEQCQ